MAIIIIKTSLIIKHFQTDKTHCLLRLTLLICATLSVRFHSYLTQDRKRYRASYIVIMWAGLDTPHAVRVMESESGSRTLWGGSMRTWHLAKTQCHTALQFVFLFLQTHLMKTNDLSPLLLQPEGVQHR